MNEVLILLAVYMLPAFILFYMAVDVFLRNPRKVEHRLVSLTIFCYGMLFLEEYIRHLLPIEYSPALITYWFGNFGILILCFFTHVLFKISALDRKMPRFTYPTVFYLPLIPVFLTYLLQDNIMNSQNFVQDGIWIYPEFNLAYYITMTAGNLFHLIVIGMLYYARTQMRLDAQKRIMKLLIYVTMVVLLWDIVFGYVDFRGVMPPYPYMYAGLV